jgi:hypothetical protein
MGWLAHLFAVLMRVGRQINTYTSLLTWLWIRGLVNTDYGTKKISGEVELFFVAQQDFGAGPIQAGSEYST